VIDYPVILSVLIGGAITLAGTILANHLEHRSQQRAFKKELAKERLAEVRRYISACLEFVDLISIPTILGPGDCDRRSVAEWIGHINRHFEKWESLPVAGSARVLFVSDPEILEGLTRIDSIRLRFYHYYLDLIDGRKQVPVDGQREELKEIAERIGKRLDEVLEKI